MSGFSKAAYFLPLVVFVITVLIVPSGVQWLKRLNFGQNIREDGPQSHIGKKGTPTMGGILFIPVGVAATVAADHLMPGSNPAAVLLLSAFALGGLFIGWLDDYLSIKRGKSLGLKARQKLIMQIVLCALFLFGASRVGPAERLAIPVAVESAFSWYHWLVLLIICVWLINAANIADGLDGLAAAQGVVAILSILFGVWALSGGHPQTVIMPVCMIGALLGFLWFNAPPARVFMGDTGSIALGCFVAGYGLLSAPVSIVLLATAVWSLEALSVVVQVSYFKLTHGKRIFRMAPIHHHFELCGWPETQVTVRFVIASIVLGILAPMALAGIAR
ncbi:MAG: phospho-N-acetylmuramoyl-pentapeptide-transferase [Armatimonadetes bacterium]|nr:phospho-N-acetylmuramoyl-pentapeptide-transferase [Armatimonadota bacterium]